MKSRIFTFILVFLSFMWQSTQAQCPRNMDFELGNTTMWNYFVGRCCPISTPTATLALPNRHTLTSGTGLDRYGRFPIVSPGGGYYSMRIGNDSVLSNAEKARYYVRLPTGASTYSLVYRYAIVLENPSHTPADQPRFEVKAFDSASGLPVDCAQFTYVSSSSLPGFRSSTVRSNVYYKDWTTATINLSGLGGRTIAVDFASGDCDLGGHFGYGYIDMTCGLFEVTIVSCDTDYATVTAPDGFGRYEWYDSTFSTAYDTTQIAVLPIGSTPRTFAVIIIPFTGYGCPDTLYTRIIPSHLDLHRSRDTVLCAATPLTLTSGATDIIPITSYSWAPATGLSCTTCANPVANPTVTTTYTVTVTDSGGCVRWDTIRITILGLSSTQTHTNCTCYGDSTGTASVTVMGGYMPYFYSWSTVPVRTTSSVTGLPAGVYTVTISDTSRCGDVQVITITQPPALVLRVLGTTNPSICGSSDGRIDLAGFDTSRSYIIRYLYRGSTYSITQTSTSTGIIGLNGLTDGTYDSIRVVTVGCQYNIINGVVLTNPPFAISGTTSSDAHCSACDGVIVLRGLTPGQLITINYRYNGIRRVPLVFTSTASGEITLTDLCPGVYDSITATLNTCVTAPVGPIRINRPPLLTMAHYSYTQPTECGACDGSITVKGIPPGEIDTIFYTRNGIPQTPIISTATPDSLLTIFNLCGGVYNNFFVMHGPCPSPTIRIPITLVDPVIVPNFNYSIQLGCKGDTVTFTNTSSSVGSLWYVWTFGDGASDTTTHPVHIYTAQNNYHVTLKITNHFCIDSISRDFSLIHPIKAQFGPIDTTVCQGTPIRFANSSIGTPPTFNWSFGDGITDIGVTPTHTFTNTGTYRVQLIATNSVPCSDTAYHVVIVDSLTEMSMTLSDTVLCQGTYITMSSNYTGIGLTGNVWDFGNGDSIKDKNPVSYAYLGTGTFNIKHNAQYRVCNSVSISRKVTVIPQPNLDLGPDTTICVGNEAITISDDRNAANPTAQWLWNTGSTSNSITVTTPGVYAVKLNLSNCTTTDSLIVREDCYLHIPNVFSPNDDGVNDFFCPRNLIAKGLVKFKMSIYNRWGQLIFETINIDGRGWDGKFNGLPQTQGVYVYKIDAIFRDGTSENRTGNVTLLR